MKEDFSTIARGDTPEDAFWFAKNFGLNGPEIAQKEKFVEFAVPRGKSPYQHASDLLNGGDLNINENEVACVQIRKKNRKAPKEDYFITKRISAYLFFGYA